MPDPPGYRVSISPAATRALERLPRDARRRVRLRIEALATGPRPPGARALRGPERLLRIRVGDYRVVYRVVDATHAVQVVWVGHRKDAYRN